MPKKKTNRERTKERINTVDNSSVIIIKKSDLTPAERKNLKEVPLLK